MKVRAAAWTSTVKRGESFQLSVKVGRKKHLAKVMLYPAALAELSDPKIQARYVQREEGEPFPLERVEAFASAVLAAAQRLAGK